MPSAHAARPWRCGLRYLSLGSLAASGVNTGEVVTGTEERLATGDAVNVAARFEQAAMQGEVLIGEPTLALVHEAVVAEPFEPLTLKGKSDAGAGLSASSPVLDAPERTHASRFVGRERELRSLRRGVGAGAGAERRCRARDGGRRRRSRQVAAGRRGAGPAFAARVVRGRCLPYGAGITYWPVAEVVKQLAVLPVRPCGGRCPRSAPLLGESGSPATSGDEIAWAFRKLLEEQAPLVVVLDDIQWGDETFLNLVESTALLAAGAPLLLLCMARPELAERRFLVGRRRCVWSRCTRSRPTC